MTYSEQERERLESYLNIHLKRSHKGLSADQKIVALQKRDRKMWYRMVLNVFIMALFGYSYYYDITNLGSTILIILGVVFLVNVGMIFYQKKQIHELIAYLRHQT